MGIDKTIDEMLLQDKGLKKLVRKLVYRAVAPLLRILKSESNERSAELLLKFEGELSQYDSRLSQKDITISNLETNIRNNNDIIKYLQNEVVRHDSELKKVLDYTLTIGEAVKKNESVANSKMPVTTLATAKMPATTPVTASEVVQTNSSEDDSYIGIDYFDFENRFRGSREKIKKVQEQYLTYYLGKKRVVDIGCGRGEFLELLKDNNIGAIGIDLYGKSIECCKLMGLEVLQEDAIKYLGNCESVDGVFAGQLVEHLTIGQIIKLCEVAYEKLEDDCYMILETPNPTSLAIYTHAFYMDPSHEKPVHPLTLQYCAQKAGFKDVKILYTQSSLLPVSIPKLESPDILNLEEFNNAMEIVSGTLFGSQDYAIIAKK